MNSETFFRSFDSFMDLTHTVKLSTGSARIAINEWLSPFNVRMAQIEAPAGMETKIKLTPTYRSSSHDIKILHPEDRHCRFHDEVKENSMFKHYRKEGCLYECRINYAKQKAGCIPWDYPTIMNMTDTEICTGGRWRNGVFVEGSLEVFETHMQNDSALTNCNCEPNCEEVVYHAEVKFGLKMCVLFNSFIPAS